MPKIGRRIPMTEISNFELIQVSRWNGLPIDLHGPKRYALTSYTRSVAVSYWLDRFPKISLDQINRNSNSYFLSRERFL